MNLQKAESMRVKVAGTMFINAAKKVPSDKARLAPADQGASAYDIVQHLTGANHFFMSMINNETPEEMSGDPSLSYEDSLSAFQASVEALAHCMARVPDDELKDSRDMPWGQTWKVQNILMGGSLHIAYHWGQIGYLQTTWGDDTDYHLL